jgi:hypothetical protein
LFEKKITEEENEEEKTVFLRNIQIQKQFSEYFYDKDKVKKAKKDLDKDSENKKLLKDQKNTSNDGTTKFTTQLTITKN